MSLIFFGNFHSAGRRRTFGGERKKAMMRSLLADKGKGIDYNDGVIAFSFFFSILGAYLYRIHIPAAGAQQQRRPHFFSHPKKSQKQALIPNDSPPLSLLLSPCRPGDSVDVLREGVRLPQAHVEEAEVRGRRRVYRQEGRVVHPPHRQDAR